MARVHEIPPNTAEEEKSYRWGTNIYSVLLVIRRSSFRGVYLLVAILDVKNTIYCYSTCSIGSPIWIAVCLL